MVNLVVIDHHPLTIDFTKPNIKVIETSNLARFYKEVKSYLTRDYDLVVSDEDPDGITSVIIYSLFKNKVVNFQGNKKGLKEKDLEELANSGIENILALDWWPLAFTDLDAFTGITYLNPRSSGLPNVNTSEIVYQALPETGNLGRDISAIGTVCDYTVETALEKFRAVIEAYPRLFPELLQLTRTGKLDRESAYSIEGKKTNFYELSLMFWAPLIIEGKEANKKLVSLIVNNPNLTLTDLIDGSKNPAAQYLTKLYRDLTMLIKKERDSFYRKRQVLGNVHFYEIETHRPGFMSKFSSIICDELNSDDIVVAAKVIFIEDKKTYIGYSLRTRGARNLGSILKELKVGGGHEKAAGAKIPLDQTEWFERELISRVARD